MPLEDGVKLVGVQNSGLNELQDASEILGAGVSKGYGHQMLGDDYPGTETFHFGFGGLLERFLVQSVAGEKNLHQPSFDDQVFLLITSRVAFIVSSDGCESYSPRREHYGAGGRRGEGMYSSSLPHLKASPIPACRSAAKFLRWPGKLVAIPGRPGGVAQSAQFNECAPLICVSEILAFGLPS